MSNGYGDYQTTLHASMRAYDRLPPRLRHACQVAVGPYAAQPILKALKQGASEQMIIRTMRLQDTVDTLATYGPTHPEAWQRGQRT